MSQSSEYINTTAKTYVTMSTFLYEALLKELNLTHPSNEETLAALKTVKMVISPIQQSERVNNIPYLCNHVVTSQGDNLLCFTMYPYINQLNQIIVKIAADQLAHIQAAIAFNHEHCCISLHTSPMLVHSNYPFHEIQKLEFLGFSLGISEFGVHLESNFAIGMVGQNSYSVNMIDLTSEHCQM